MKKRIKSLLLFPVLVIGAALLLNGCESSQITTEWHDPEYHAGPMKDVLVLSVWKNKTARRIWEDAFVSVLKSRGINAVPSYRYYPNQVPKEDDIPNMLKDKYDGLILVQKVNEQNRRYFVPGYYGYGWPFYRRYGWMYGSMWDGGYIAHERTVEFETSVWEPSTDGNMIFSVVTETYNPTSYRNVRDDILKLVIPKLAKNGIIPKAQGPKEM